MLYVKKSISLILTLLLVSCNQGDTSPRDMNHIVIGTGFHKRTYFHLGNSLCKVLHIGVAYMRREGRKHDLLCSAPSSPASRTSLREVQKLNLDFGFSQGNRINDAYLGKGFSNGKKLNELRVVAKTHHEGFFIVKNPNVSNSIIDIGNKRGGAAKLFLELKENNFLPEYNNSKIEMTGKAWEVRKRFCSNEIEYMVFLDPDNYEELRHVLSKCGGIIQHLNKERADQIIKKLPYLDFVEKEKKGVLALPSYLIANSKISDHAVHELLLSMKAHLSLLEKESVPLKNMMKGNICNAAVKIGVQAPFHRAAKKFYKGNNCVQ